MQTLHHQLFNLVNALGSTEGPEVAGTGAEGIGAGVVDVWGATKNGPSDPLALALRVPGKLTVGLSKF